MSVNRSFSDAIKINRIALQGFGALPLGGPPSKWKTGLSYFLAAVTCFCSNVVVGPMIHVLIVTPSEDLDDFLDIVLLIVSLSGGLIRALLMIMNRRKLQSLITTCETWWADASPADHKIISVWGNLGVLVSKGLLCNGFFTAFAYMLTPFVIQLMSSDDSAMRTLPFRTSMNTSVSPQYEVVFFVQAVAAQSIALSIIGGDVMVIVLILHVCGQMKLIQNWLNDMTAHNAKTEDGSKLSEDFEETLIKCIKRHQIVLNYCNELEEFVSNINLDNVLAWMCVLSLSAASFLKAGSYRSVTLTCVGIGQLFFLCWPAQILSSTSYEIVEAAYGVPWYRSAKRDRIAISIMITRAQRPAALTAGKYAVLSLETFSTIVSSAVSFFLVLQNL